MSELMTDEQVRLAASALSFEMRRRHKVRLARTETERLLRSALDMVEMVSKAERWEEHR
jgi:hypothetical protein